MNSIRPIRPFIEMRFPTNIACGSLGGPEYCTNIVTTAGGYEQRNSSWSNARRKFNVTHGVKNEVQFKQLSEFFHNCRGRAIGFRFKDWSDYKVSQEIVAQGDGKRRNFQLQKTYSVKTIDGSTQQHTRHIHKIVQNTAQFYLVTKKAGEVEKFRSNQYNEHSSQHNMKRMRIKNTINAEGDVYLNYNTGIIITDKILTEDQYILANFEFDVPARFDTDIFPTTIEGTDLYKINDIHIIEIKL